MYLYMLFMCDFFYLLMILLILIYKKYLFNWLFKKSVE